MQGPDFDYRATRSGKSVIVKWHACEPRAVEAIESQIPQRVYSEVGQTFWHEVRRVVCKCMNEGRIVFDGSVWTIPL